jgi:hypothetical protein
MTNQAAGVNISIKDIIPSQAGLLKRRTGSCLQFGMLYFPYSWARSQICSFPDLKYIDCKVFMHGTLNFHRVIYIYSLSLPPSSKDVQEEKNQAENTTRQLLASSTFLKPTTDQGEVEPSPNHFHALRL